MSTHSVSSGDNQTRSFSIGVAIALLTATVALNVFAQQVDAKLLATRRQTAVSAIWQNGYTFLKPEYRPSLADVTAALSTPQNVVGALRREEAAMQEAQRLLKGTETVEGHVRFLGKILDSMMGALIAAGTGSMRASAPDGTGGTKGGKVRAAEDLLNMQPYVDAANQMIDCCARRQKELAVIIQIDQTLAQSTRPAHFPGSNQPRPKGSPYAF